MNEYITDDQSRGTTSLERLTKKLVNHEYENVYIYVGDAVRWDFLDSRIEDLGTLVKTVASSTSSAPSYSSLLTGLYPPSHGVHSFSNQIPETIPTIHDMPLTTTFVNSIQDDPTSPDPIYSIQNREPLSKPFDFTDITQPFAVIERGPGGHAPYDGIGEADTSYFDSIAEHSPRKLREQYRTKIMQDADRFLRRLEELEKAGVRDQTLIIYTADHGELLGEGGLLGHSGPMRPELVYVPTVFIGPTVNSGSLSAGLFRHVDLFPTLIDILGVDKPAESLDGQPLSAHDKNQGLSVMRLPFASETLVGGELFYEGVWYRNGGHVFPKSSRVERTKILVGKLVKSPKRRYLRRNVYAAVGSYLYESSTFGDCPPRTEAERYLPTDYVPISNYRLNETERESLRDLGYIE